jgi:hypothetical protein
LDKCPSASPIASSSIQSFDPDTTPRSWSNIGYHDRHASFDGGAELLEIHGARLCEQTLSNFYLGRETEAEQLLWSSPRRQHR